MVVQSILSNTASLYSITSATTVGGQRRPASASSLLALGTSAEEEQEAFAIIVISEASSTIIINQLLSLNIAEGSDFVSFSQVLTTLATFKNCQLIWKYT